MMLLLHSTAGATVEPFDDIKYPGSHYTAKERPHSALENALAIVILVALITLPWLTGAVWLAAWVYRAIFGHDVSAIGSENI